MRLLVIEDHEDTRRNIKAILDRFGFEVDVASDGKEGICLAQENPYDLIWLDSMLPALSGPEVIKQLRMSKNSTPILMVSCLSEDIDMIGALNNGADDYIAKPFNVDVVIARIRALVRRQQDILESTFLKAAGVEMDLVRREVRYKNSEVKLTKKEFDVLEFFLRRINRPLTKEVIAAEVWKKPTESNVVEVVIRSLREKIAKDLIETVHGLGYKLNDDDPID